MNRNKLFTLIREGQSLYQKEKFTRAFNLLTQVEKFCQGRLYIRAKVIRIKVNCLVKVGNIEAANSYIQQLLTDYPYSGQISYLAATFYSQLGKTYFANKLYAHSIRLSPENISFSLSYGQFLREMNRPTEAIRVLRAALLLSRKSKDNHNTGLYYLYLELAHLYFASSQFKRSLILFNHTSNMNDQFPYYDLMAECFLSVGDYEQALDCVELQIDHWGENDPEVLFIYAKALSGLGFREEAIGTLKKCRDLWGELIITPIDLAHLYSLVQDGSLKNIKNTIIQV